MSDDELKEALDEIRKSEETGIIGDVVRHWARKSGEITGGFTTTDFYMTQVNILREAAFRWTKPQIEIQRELKSKAKSQIEFYFKDFTEKANSFWEENNEPLYNYWKGQVFGMTKVVKEMGLDIDFDYWLRQIP